MKYLVFFTFILFFNISKAQVQDFPADSLEITQKGRNNASWAKNAPYIILISADGFRYDYPELHSATFLSRMQYYGQRAKAMLPSYPSVTGPNHYSLVTGLYPSHHGMVDNHFYDESRQEAYYFGKAKNIQNGSWLGGKPLWGVAERSGMLTASLMWVASDGDAGGTRPTYSYRYSGSVSMSQKVNQVVKWLKLPEVERPHLIHLYFPEVDAAGHIYGPESIEARQAVQSVDKSLENLTYRVGALGLDVRFIFVSDHGMMKVDTENPIPVPEILLDKEKFRIENAQTLLRVNVLDKKQTIAVYQKLKNLEDPRYRVTLATQMPQYLNYSQKDDYFNRMGEIFLRPYSPNIFLLKGQRTTLGKHGYDPREVPEMKAVFMTWKSRSYTIKTDEPLLPEFENVEIYPLVLNILGLKAEEKIDGKGVLISQIK